MSGSYRRIGDVVVHRTPWLAVREYDIERAGIAETYSVVGRADAVVVIPLTPPERTILLKHFRFPLNGSSWEWPIGAVEPGEGAEAAARRELFEEVGLPASDLIQIGEYQAAPGLMAQTVTVFLAPVGEESLDGLKRLPGSYEEIEEIAIVGLDRFGEMVRGAAIIDAFSLVAYLLLLLHQDPQTLASARE